MPVNMKCLLFLLLVLHYSQGKCDGSFLTRGSADEIYKNRMRAEEYDYIVVGSGSAGAVVAARLVEETDVTVLLLESGGLPTGLSEIPLTGVHLLGTELDWAYYTEPQEEACLGIKNRQAYMPRGKALGGSTTINSLLYVRGDKRDFDEWAKGGATGWSWDEVLHYFKKLEDMRDPELAKKGYHGVGGPQTVSLSDYESDLEKAIFGAAQEAGHQLMDINAESPLGFSRVQGSVRDGRRWGTEKGYLRPAADKENLDILYNAHVTKILFTEDKRAHAVRFAQNNASHVVRARKEIILSAGAFGTPQLLMLSGIGPKEHLQELGIPVIADLPVGENLQDHVMVGSQAYVLNSSVGLLHSRMLRNPEYLGQFMDGKGPITVPLSVEVLGAMNSKYQDPAERWPDVRLFFLSILLLPPVADDGKDKVQFLVDQEGMTVNPMVCRPKSRGFVKLRSTDPFEYPIVDPKYLTHEDDVKILIEGMKAIEELVEQPSLAKYDPVRAPQVVPGCEGMDTRSDEYLICVARRLTITGYHQCCTAKMGNPTNPTTVVDPELRVKGVSGLRVADSSIMPDITSGNTNAPSIMIGEKAADLIRGRYWDPVRNEVVTKDRK